MATQWTSDQLRDMARRYQAAAVLDAAAELDFFRVLLNGPVSASDLSTELQTDLRGTTMLLDALVALELVEKQNQLYRPAAGVGEVLGGHGPGSILAMTQHQANCMRCWSELAQAAKTGKPVERRASTRGEEADEEAFITAMDNIGAPIAVQLISEIGPLQFKHVLDVGGASGTWTIALLTQNPRALATIFDLPHVIPLAEQRLAAAELIDRVQFAPGDFYVDTLPTGFDLVFISAIIHQNSREQNRRLFSAAHAALTGGGRLIIRDVLMDHSRTSPATGAMFALHMLVATEGGGVFTLGEYEADLEAAGFSDVTVLRRDPGMNSFVSACK